MIQRSNPNQPPGERGPQLGYSELQDAMLDEAGRRKKAAKIVQVLSHFLGVSDFSGLNALDIGCSTGFISDTLAKSGAQVTGIDIDEPGLARARERFGLDVEFIAASGESIPLPDESVDIVVFNHIYEHVPDPDAIMREIRRVLRSTGVAYLGFANKLGIVEPHYKLPFLSWLPKPAANVYIRRSGRAETYYETFRTRRGLKKMCGGLNIWEYTYPVLAEPSFFEAEDMVPKWLSNTPPLIWRALASFIPTYIWVATPGEGRPRGRHLRVDPSFLVPARL